MADVRIVILDDQREQLVGLELKIILDRENRYRVNLIGRTLPGAEEVWATPADLIIPVLPSAEERAKQLLAKLREAQVDATLLPVISSENLSKMLDGPRPWTRDFLISPLREAEVRARIRQWFPPRSGDREMGSVKEEMIQSSDLRLLVGTDPAFLAVKRKIHLIAQFESTVLITGETGTGKEMCARALHYSSRRSAEPFLPVNCGAVPAELFENELFGHQKGAFTSAWAAQRGLISEAEGGTLFLDEIETLSLGPQAKLLRFLQDQTYHVLGCSRSRKANVWIIASTNVDLRRKVQEGGFRGDLFYRLAVITLALPPLRERRVDIPLLALHFWRTYGPKDRRDKMQLSPRALEALCGYSWPGNIRELENVMQQLIVFTEAQIIEPEDLPIQTSPGSDESGGTGFKQAKAHVIEQFERTYVTELLRARHGNVTHAALAADMERRAFGRLVKKYQIQ